MRPRANATRRVCDEAFKKGFSSNSETFAKLLCYAWWSCDPLAWLPFFTMRTDQEIQKFSGDAGQKSTSELNARAGESSNIHEEKAALRAQEKLLVDRAKAGDQEAFRQLFDAHHQRAYAVAMGVVKNTEDAFDVVQEAFIKVHRHLDSFQGGAAFYTWLYRIVMNLSIDHLRKKQRARTESYEDRIDRMESQPAENAHMPGLRAEDPDESLGNKELSVKIQQALSTLPEHHRAVIVLREVEGMSYEEMAEALQVPKGTIMSRLFHARRKMQDELQSYVGQQGVEHAS